MIFLLYGQFDGERRATPRLTCHSHGAAQMCIRDRGVAFTTRVDFDVPLIMGDWEKLRRVLANLTSNAVKFTDAGEMCIRDSFWLVWPMLRAAWPIVMWPRAIS